MPEITDIRAALVAGLTSGGSFTSVYGGPVPDLGHEQMPAALVTLPALSSTLDGSKGRRRRREGEFRVEVLHRIAPVEGQANEAGVRMESALDLLLDAVEDVVEADPTLGDLVLQSYVFSASRESDFDGAAAVARMEVSIRAIWYQ